MDYLKKMIISLFLCIILLLSAFSFTVCASPTHTMNLSFTETDDGKLEVAVYIPQPDKLTGIDFSVTLSAENAEIESLNIKNTDIEKTAVDFDNISESTEEKEFFTYTTTESPDKISFSGFFINSLSSDKNFRICNIIIAKNGVFSEDDTLSFSYTISCELCSKTDKHVYSLINKDISDTEHKNSYPLGDADLDGKVNSSDARKILRASVGLDKLSLEEFPYANSDYDNSITASDARYALRTSVGLEKNIMHSFDIILGSDSKCEDGGTYTFICEVTGKSFSMEIEKGGHLCHDTDCFNTGKCEICNEVIHPATGHKFNENGICSVCSADKAILNETTEKLIPVLEEINNYDVLADEALNSNKRIDFIRYTHSAAKSIKNAAEICKGIKGLEKVEEHLLTAYKIRFQAFVSVTDDDGKILSSTGNCNAILAAVKKSNKHIDYASYLYE